MSGSSRTGAGSGARGLNHWQTLADLRQTAAPDPVAAGVVVANPLDQLVAAGVDVDAPMAPGLSRLTMRDVLGQEASAAMQSAAAADALSPTSSDAYFVRPQIVLPLANVVVVANAFAIVNVNGIANVNAGANANAGVNANALSNANISVNVNVTGGPCFVAGTRILTEDGEVPVEALLAGQRVVTISGEGPTLVPISWIGERSVSTPFHPQPDTVIPIRITRDALGEGVPKRDLLVSPDHAVFLDGVLIPARLLVNKTTIIEDGSQRTINYFHVELQRHAVLVAEGLAAESYLDTGNRGTFINGDEPLVLHPNLAATPDLTRWEKDACAPLAIDAETVEPIRRRVAGRALGLGRASLGAATTGDPDLPPAADGQRRRKRPTAAPDRTP